MLIVMGDYARRFRRRFSGLCAGLEQTARPDGVFLITGRRTPVSPQTRLTHCERSSARTKSWAPVRPIAMPLDILSLQSFYGSPLGGVARRLIGRVIRERWESSTGLSIAPVGCGGPYLDGFRA